MNTYHVAVERRDGTEVHIIHADSIEYDGLNALFFTDGKISAVFRNFKYATTAKSEENNFVYAWDTRAESHPEYGLCLFAKCPQCHCELKKFQMMTSYNVLKCDCGMDWELDFQAKGHKS